MIHVMLMVIAAMMILLAAMAIAMLRAMNDIRMCLYAMDSTLITADEMEQLMTMPRPPNTTNPQARADEYTSPLVKRASQQLIQRRIEAANG